MHDSRARRPTTPARVTAIGADSAVERPDQLVTEEPMEIRVHGPGQEPTPLAVTMRTPGHDFELGVGFCVSEGVIGSADDLATVAYCLGPERGQQEYNIVTVRLRAPVDLEDGFIDTSRLYGFGRSEERRTERRLIAEYEALIGEILGRLSPANHSAAVALAGLPLEIRGFGHVKETSLARAKPKEAALLAAFRSPDAPAMAAD